ncbi:uncharacterized protein L203_102642 [Cryptococcus depauperatus CBS 7841]|uniref:Uncharacterized protein n=1 Tax=Cryptococcus depauperatus CBS 7841 TaxID=1295531 RepID=A0A1E3IDT9_9TREE|nr:hypothetical protein L203_04007 [Cryptococcus depauperatus CBS 7841]
MQSPLKGDAGRSGILTQSSIEEVKSGKGRRGRNVDVIGMMPTPHSKAALSTPETVRRSSRKSNKEQGRISHSYLPTPQTQRHRRHISPPSHSHNDHPPSPSGHTSFYLSAKSNRSEVSVSRRRPGLMFVQKMEAHSASGPSRGVGVGMGGHRISGSKMDHVNIEHKEDNPFLVSSPPNKQHGLGEPIGLASPGAITNHHPRESLVELSDDDVEPLSSPIQSRRSKRPNFETTISGLLSPPPTKHAPRIAVDGIPQTRTQVASRSKSSYPSKEYLEMLDVAQNPFLAQPGESSNRVLGPIIDEDQPTVTYIFRGAKRVFANPLWSKKTPFPQADLRPEEDDFEPHPLPKPRLLWPEGPSPSKRIDVGKMKESSRSRNHTPSSSSVRLTSPPSSPIATSSFSHRLLEGKLASSMSTPLELGHARTNQEGNGDGDAYGEIDNGEFKPLHEQDVEDSLPVRRGLLFGGRRMKRERDGGEEKCAKKIKGLGRL